MARITVEDCIEKVQNKFELVILAAERGKDINSGTNVTVDRDNDKDAVVALREIALGNVKTETLKETIIRKLQTTNTLIPVDDETLHLDNTQLDDQVTDVDYTSDDTNFYSDETDINDDNISDDNFDELDQN